MRILFFNKGSVIYYQGGGGGGGRVDLAGVSEMLFGDPMIFWGVRVGNK